MSRDASIETSRLQHVKNSLAEFRVRRRERGMIRFLPRHVRGRKHFARSERRIVRCQRTTEAQNEAKLSRKSGKATFSTVSRPRCGFCRVGGVYHVVMSLPAYLRRLSAMKPLSHSAPTAMKAKLPERMARTVSQISAIAGCSSKNCFISS